MECIVKSVNISENKGTTKKPVNDIKLDISGIINDAHSGKWHRQVSLLATEQIDKFSQQFNRNFNYGDFAENITTEGIDFHNVNVFDVLYNDNIELMITQKGKKCHGGDCAVHKAVGQCVMPKEGVFAKVIKEGTIKVGDSLYLKPKVYNVGIVTLSDRISSNIGKDISGPSIKNIITNYFNELNYKVNFEYHLIPDNSVTLNDLITKLTNECDIIFTTGGTGISTKDITIETIMPLLHKQLTGIMEMIRFKYGQTNPKALLSRSIAGTINKTLIFCLPGSAKAVNEYLQEIIINIEHLLYMINDIDNH